MRIFTLLAAEQAPGGPRLVVLNNAPGMDRASVHECLSFGYSNKLENDVGMVRRREWRALATQLASSRLR